MLISADVDAIAMDMREPYALVLRALVENAGEKIVCINLRCRVRTLQRGDPATIRRAGMVRVRTDRGPTRAVPSEHHERDDRRGSGARRNTSGLPVLLVSISFGG